MYDVPKCPIHGIPDCSPMLNGCSLVIRAVNERVNGGPAEQPPEPKSLLAGVIDIQNRRYFRWSYDVHTHTPWQLVGAVHVHDEEPDLFRWSDLPAVAVITQGLPV